MKQIIVLFTFITITIQFRLATADVVYLKDGGKIEGIIVSENDNELEIEIGIGTTIVDKKDVIKIDSSSVSEKLKLKTEWKDNKNKSEIYSKEVKSKKREVMPYEPEEIIIFTTVWCPKCYMAKSFFDTNGINYTEYDIEKSEVGNQMYKPYGVNGVPLVIIGNAQFLGFRPKEMIKELKKYKKYQ